MGKYRATWTSQIKENAQTQTGAGAMEGGTYKIHVSYECMQRAGIHTMSNNKFYEEEGNTV